MNSFLYYTECKFQFSLCLGLCQFHVVKRNKTLQALINQEFEVIPEEDQEVAEVDTEVANAHHDSTTT